MERPNATFCNGNSRVLNNFCLAEFSVYYTLENKSTKTCDISQTNLMIIWLRITMKSVLTPLKVKLIISGETMRCRKVRRIFRYHEPNKLLALGKFTHYVLLLFYLIRDEKELLSGFPPLQQNKLQKQSVHAFVTIS